MLLTCEVTKPLMVLDAMITSPEHEWIVWTDDDNYINTGGWVDEW